MVVAKLADEKAAIELMIVEVLVEKTPLSLCSTIHTGRILGS